MILFTVDPINRTAGMLSIPRDLWVNIPGYGYGRINTAYMLGEGNKYPEGGGPGLAMKTVKSCWVYRSIIMPRSTSKPSCDLSTRSAASRWKCRREMIIDPLGDDNTKTLRPGVQTLDGSLALAYARARKTEGGDFDRAQRQQQVIMAIRDQILRFDMLPTLISKAPVLYNQVSAGVHTNMTLEQAIKLAWLAVQIPEEKINRGVISTPEQVLLATAPDGAAGAQAGSRKDPRLT